MNLFLWLNGRIFGGILKKYLCGEKGTVFDPVVYR